MAVIGALVVFVAVNDGTEPEPEAAKPIAVFELVQEYVVFATSAAKDCEDTDTPLHTTTFDTAVVIEGVGFTVTVTFVG